MEAAAVAVDVHAVEICFATVFAGHVKAQPVVEVVTNAESEQRRRVEALVDVLERLGGGVLRAEQFADALIAETDIAAQIPT